MSAINILGTVNPAGGVREFRVLCVMSKTSWYGNDRATNYACQRRRITCRGNGNVCNWVLLERLFDIIKCTRSRMRNGPWTIALEYLYVRTFYIEFDR